MFFGAQGNRSNWLSPLASHGVAPENQLGGLQVAKKKAAKKVAKKAAKKKVAKKKVAKKK